MEPIDNQFAKQIDDLFSQVKSLISKGEDSVKFPHEMIWKNDTVEYIQKAKAKYNELIDSKPEFESYKSHVQEQFNTRINTLQSTYNSKLYTAEVDKLIYPINDNLNRAATAVGSNHENIWKNDTIEYLTNAKKLFEPFEAEPKYVGVQTRDKMVATFNDKYKETLTKHNAKLHSKAMDTELYTIKSNMDKAENAVKQPHENQYKNDSMEYFSLAKEAFKKLEENSNYIGIPEREDMVKKFNQRQIDFFAAYSSKVYYKEFDQASYKVKDNLDRGEKAVESNHENVFKNDTMEYLGNARKALEELEANENLRSLSDFQPFVTKSQDRIKALLVKYSDKVYYKEFDQASYKVKDNLDRGERAVDSNHENVFKNDTMEYLGLARKALEEVESNDNFKSLKEYEPFVTKSQERIRAIMVKYGDKVYAKELDALIYPITSNMDKAERALQQPHENQYKNDSMEYLSLVRKAMEALESNENLTSFAQRDEVLLKTTDRLKKFLVAYGDKVYSKEMETVVFHITDNFNKAERALQQPHENQYKNDSMEYYGNTVKYLRELTENPNYASVEGRDDVIVKYTVKLDEFLPMYSTKVYSKEMETEVFHIKDNIDRAFRALDQPHENQYKNDSMEYFSKCRELFSKFQDESKYVGLSGRDELIQTTTAKIPEFLEKYSTKVYSKQMETEIFHLKDFMDKAERAVDQPQENVYRDDSMEYLGKAKEALRTLETQTNYIGLPGRDQVISNVRERIPKFMSKYSDKVFTKSMEKEIFEINDNIGKAERSLEQPHENIYRNDSIEYFSKAREVFKSFSDNQDYLGLPGRDELLVSFSGRSDKFLQSYGEKVTLKDFEKASYQVTSNLDKMQTALDSHIQEIYKNDSMHYFGQAKQEFKSVEENRSFVGLKEREELVAKYEERTSKFLFDYNIKIYSKEFEKLTFPIKQLLGFAETNLKKGPPKQFWTDGLEQIVKAKELMNEFQEKDEFKSMAERDEIIADFKTRYESFMTEYSEKVHLEDLKSQITELESLLNTAETTFKKGPPKQWWSDSLEQIVKAKGKFRDFEEKSEFKGMKDREAFVEKFNNRVLAYQIEYNDRVLAHDLDDAISTLKSSYSNAKSTFNKGNNKATWLSGFEMLIKTRDQFNEFKSNSTFIGTGPKRDTFVKEFEDQIDSFKNEYREKVFLQEIKDAIDPIRSKMNDAEATFKKAPPKQWYNEALEKTIFAKQLFKEFEEKEEYAGVAIREEFIKEFNSRLEKFIDEYNTKVLAHDVQAAITSLKSAFSNAETTFSKGSKAWWDLGLEQMVRAQQEFNEFLHKPEYIGIGERDSFILAAKDRIEKFKVQYNQVVFQEELNHQIDSIKSLFSQAKTDFQRGSKIFYTQSLEKVVKCKQMLKTFEEKTEFVGIPVRESFVKEFGDSLAAYTKEYNEKVLIDDIKTAVQEINSRLTDAESTFRNAHCRQFLDDSFKKLVALRPLFVEFEANAQYHGIPTREDFVVSTNQRIKKLEGDYNERVFMDELKAEIESLESQFATVLRIFKQGTKLFWDESYVKFSSTLEAFKKFQENAKFHSIPVREEFVDKFQKKLTDYDLEYKEKALGEEVRNSVDSIRSKLDQAETLYKKSSFREYWDDALVRMVEAKKLYLEFADNKLYNGIPVAEDLKKSFPERLGQFEKLYQDKYGFEAESLKAVQKEEKQTAGAVEAEKPVEHKDGTKILRKEYALGLETLLPIIPVNMDTPPALIGISGSYNTFVKKIAALIVSLRKKTSFNEKGLKQLTLLKPNAGYDQYYLERVFREIVDEKDDTVIELNKSLEGLKKQIAEIKSSSAKDLPFTLEIFKAFDKLVADYAESKKEMKLKGELIDNLLQCCYRLEWIQKLRENSSSRGDRLNYTETFLIQYTHSTNTITFLSFNREDRQTFRNAINFVPAEASKILNEKAGYLKIQLKDCFDKYDGFFEYEEALGIIEELTSQALASLLRQTKLKSIHAPTGADANYLKAIEDKFVRDLKAIDLGLNSGFPYKEGSKPDEKHTDSENASFYGKAVFNVNDPPLYLTKRDVERNNRTQFIHGADTIYVRYYLPEPLSKFPIAVWNVGNKKGQPFYPINMIGKFRNYNDTHNPRVQVNILINGTPLANPKDASGGFYSEDCWEIYNSARSFGLPIYQKRIVPNEDNASFIERSKLFHDAIEAAGVGTHKIEVQFRYGYFNTQHNQRNAFDVEQPDFDIDYTTISTSTFEITKVADLTTLVEKIPVGPESLTKLPYQETIVDATWDACNKPHSGKIVFAESKIAPMLAKTESVKLKSDFKFGSDVYGRLVIPNLLRDYPLGIYKDGPFKGKPFYAKDELKKSPLETHQILVRIDATINGKKVHRNQSEGNSLYTFFAGKLYSTQRTFGFNLLNAHGVQHTLSNKKLLSGFFASHLLEHGAGKHKVQFEARFKLAQTPTNKSTAEFDQPNFDTEWSDVIAAGEISIQVEANTKLYDFLPVTQKQRDDVQFLLSHFQKDPQCGAAQPPKEILALQVAKDWSVKEWRTPTKVTKVYGKYSSDVVYEVVEKLPKVPLYYGLDVVLYLYQNSENGFTDDRIERIQMTIQNTTNTTGYHGSIGAIKNRQSSTFSPNILPVEALSQRLSYQPANKSKDN